MVTTAYVEGKLFRHGYRCSTSNGKVGFDQIDTFFAN